MESKYTALLIMVLRAFIPLFAVVKSAVKGLRHNGNKNVTFKATAHEDNQGALILVSLEPGRHTVRSKFYSLRQHWFRDWIQTNKIRIAFIDTHKQKADFLTKAPSPVVFKQNRELSIGWYY